MNAVIAILAAIHHRDQTGAGQQIDISLFESQVAALLNSASSWLNTKTKLGRTGNDHPSAAPYGVYEVDDGHIIVATFNDREFARLATILGHPEWLTDPRFARNGDRVVNRPAIKAAVREALKGKTRAEWVKILNDATVSAGPINDVEDLEHDEHAVARELFVSMKTRDLGTVRTVAAPFRFSLTQPNYRLPPPSLGEHTDEVLGELGLDAGELQRLRDEAVI
jgi:crotonobetainyl-CoA:carnitine CoA-transferase CaiB-like acyl-CoA transferase